MIELKEVSKTFVAKGQRVQALDKVNLKIEKGDIFGIIGFSGAGKSTLVRCINLLERPTSGHIYINNHDMTQLKGRSLRDMRKKIGMIFQHFNLLHSRTVAGNIAYPMEISGVPKKTQRKRVGELLTLVGLEDKVMAYPSELSGGQKQRVGIARALANDPDILLCDEATSALDPKTTVSILNLLRDINEQLGLTIVIITHEMEVIKYLCTKVAVMEEGKIIEQGKVTDVFAKPQQPTTQSFVRTVTHDLPEMILTPLRKNAKLLRLNFIGDRTKEPILSYMIKQFDVHVNILLGGVDHLQQNIVGNLVIEIFGEELEINKAIKYLSGHGIHCEVINR